MKVCAVHGCNAPMLAKGLCNMHWQRMRINGHLGAIDHYIGTSPIRKDKRPQRWVSTKNGKKVREHIAIVEEALGYPL